MIPGRLLVKLGVDPDQWWALVRTSLRIDFPIQVQQKNRTERRGLKLVAFVVLFYMLAGITPAVVAFHSPDVLLGATSLTTIVAFMVASMLLMGEGSSIVSPSDHLILGFRPVTSRTYLAVRVTTLLVRSFVVSGAIAIIPAAVFLLRRGVHPGRAIAAVVSAEMTGIAVTLAIVAMYGWVLRVAGPTRTLRLTGYMQLVANTVVWLGFFAATQLLNERTLAGVSLSGTTWWLAVPATWFGSYVMLAAGDLHWMAIVAVFLSLISIGGLGWLIRDKLSMAYTEELSKLASVTRTNVSRKGRDWFGAMSDETRAVAILVRSQLEHDMKFRLTLISLIPVTAIYMVMGGWPADPFVPGARRRGSGPGMIQMVLIFLPMTLRQAIVTSESYRASWIFHTTPSDRARLVLSARNVITGFFLIPYLACLAAFLAYAFGNTTHALLHAAFLGSMSWIVLQFSIMLSPHLPFSMPHEKDTQGAMMFVRVFGVMIIGLGSYILLIRYVYHAPMRMVVAAIAIVGIGVLLDRLTRARARRRKVEEIYTD
jgi:hypothetical protein